MIGESCIKFSKKVNFFKIFYFALQFGGIILCQVYLSS
jgi:hypothetical protein